MARRIAASSLSRAGEGRGRRRRLGGPRGRRRRRGVSGAGFGPPFGLGRLRSRDDRRRWRAAGGADVTGGAVLAGSGAGTTGGGGAAAGGADVTGGTDLAGGAAGGSCRTMAGGGDGRGSGRTAARGGGSTLRSRAETSATLASPGAKILRLCHQASSADGVVSGNRLRGLVEQALQCRELRLGVGLDLRRLGAGRVVGQRRRGLGERSPVVAGVEADAGPPHFVSRGYGPLGPVRLAAPARPTAATARRQSRRRQSAPPGSTAAGGRRPETGPLPGTGSAAPAAVVGAVTGGVSVVLAVGEAIGWATTDSLPA